MKPRWGRILRYLVAAICLVWIVLIVRRLGPARVLEEARRADPVLLAVSFLPIVGRFAIWAVKWTLMLNRRGPIAFRHVALALLAGNFVNLTTPTAKLAGGFVRAALVSKRTGWGMAASYGWSLADQVTNVLGNLILYGALALGAGATLGALAAGLPYTVSGAAAVTAALVAVSMRGWAWGRVQRPGLARWLARLTPEKFRSSADGAPAAGWVRPVFEPLLHHGSTWKVAPVDLGLAACSFGSLCVANAVVLRALGAQAPLLAIAVAVVVGYFAGTLIGTLGGIGVTEAALYKLYTASGVAPEAAVAGALVHRASYYLVILICGGTALLVEGRRALRG